MHGAGAGPVAGRICRVSEQPMSVVGICEAILLSGDFSEMLNTSMVKSIMGVDEACVASLPKNTP